MLIFACYVVHRSSDLSSWKYCAPFTELYEEDGKQKIRISFDSSNPYCMNGSYFSLDFANLFFAMTFILAAISKPDFNQFGFNLLWMWFGFFVICMIDLFLFAWRWPWRPWIDIFMICIQLSYITGYGIKEYIKNS